MRFRQTLQTLKVNYYNQYGFSVVVAHALERIQIVSPAQANFPITSTALHQQNNLAPEYKLSRSQPLHSISMGGSNIVFPFERRIKPLYSPNPAVLCFESLQSPKLAQLTKPA